MKSWAGIGVHGMALENALYICGGQCERVVHILWECPAKTETVCRDAFMVIL